MTDENKILKLDLGCGNNKKAPDADQVPWTGVDSIAFPAVDVVLNLCERSTKAKVKVKGEKKGPVEYEFKAWPWEDNSVDEVHSSHFVEHLEPDERVHFVNELYRIMKPGAKALIVAPHWCSARAYGDLTHKFPPISEFWFYYLSKDWRASQAPHSSYNENVNFAATWGYALSQGLLTRNQEYQNYALANYKEAAQDIVSTWVKM